MMGSRFSTIHTPSTIGNARAVSRRRRNTPCEIFEPSERGRHKLSDPAPGPRILGRVLCSLSQAVRPNERAASDDTVASSTEYEFAFGLGIEIKPSHRLAVPRRPVPWAPGGAARAVGECVAPASWTNGKTAYFICVAAGVSDEREPVWPGRIGQTVVDGGCIWKMSGYANIYEVIAINDQETQKVEVLVRAKEIRN